MKTTRTRRACDPKHLGDFGLLASLVATAIGQTGRLLQSFSACTGQMDQSTLTSNKSTLPVCGSNMDMERILQMVAMECQRRVILQRVLRCSTGISNSVSSSTRR